VIERGKINGGVCVISESGLTEVVTTQINGNTSANTNVPPKP
jgi:hypothetical protein